MQLAVDPAVKEAGECLHYVEHRLLKTPLDRAA